jgi:hypothetical protein
MQVEGPIARWNRFYDEAPEELRFPMLVWGLVAVGGLNMLLTIWFGFPFGLLLVAAIAAMAYIRVAPRLNLPSLAAGPVEMPRWSTDATYGEPPFLASMAGSFPGLNTALDAMPEIQRLGIYLGVLALAGIINMLLTINAGFPFGLLFLVAFLGLALIRGPWVRARVRAAYLQARAARLALPAPAATGGDATPA